MRAAVALEASRSAKAASHSTLRRSSASSKPLPAISNMFFPMEMAAVAAEEVADGGGHESGKPHPAHTPQKGERGTHTYTTTEAGKEREEEGERVRGRETQRQITTHTDKRETVRM